MCLDLFDYSLLGVLGGECVEFLSLSGLYQVVVSVPCLASLSATSLPGNLVSLRDRVPVHENILTVS